MKKPDLSELIDARLRIDRMPREGRAITIAADAETREALAERLAVTEVTAMDGELTATRFRGGIRVTGRLTATIVQPCVVTLDPVTQEIDEDVDRIFLPASQRPRDPHPGTETVVDIEGEDPPDYFEGPEIDLSELVVEVLALGVDLYPRAPDADLRSLGINGDAGPESPFARLKALKRNEDEG